MARQGRRSGLDPRHSGAELTQANANMGSNGFLAASLARGLHGRRRGEPRPPHLQGLTAAFAIVFTYLSSHQ